MIDELAIRDILSVYSKHGWTIRSVLLSNATKRFLELAASDIFAEIPVGENIIDAAWFSRDRDAKTTAWELRYLGTSPYALVMHIAGDRTSGDEFDALVLQLNAAVGRSHAGH